MIEISNVQMKYPLEKRYMEYLTNPFSRNWKIALKSVNISVKKGEKIALLGANGAGKTTLLKLIGGLLYPSQGTIEINSINTVKNNLAARSHVGFVLNEERSFYWRLTGIQNLEFFGHLDNLHGKKLKNKIDELIEIVGMGHAAHRRFATYSSGMKQRLAIARGLLSEPKILILDEPTRALDPIAKEEVSTLLTNKVHPYFKQTLLIATHSLTEAKNLCDKVCIMSEGNMLLFDSVENILTKHESLHECYKSVIRQNKN